MPFSGGHDGPAGRRSGTRAASPSQPNRRSSRPRSPDARRVHALSAAARSRYRTPPKGYRTPLKRCGAATEETDGAGPPVSSTPLRCRPGRPRLAPAQPSPTFILVNGVEKSTVVCLTCWRCLDAGGTWCSGQRAVPGTAVRPQITHAFSTVGQIAAEEWLAFERRTSRQAGGPTAVILSRSLVGYVRPPARPKKSLRGA